MQIRQQLYVCAIMALVGFGMAWCVIQLVQALCGIPSVFPLEVMCYDININ